MQKLTAQERLERRRQHRKDKQLITRLLKIIKGGGDARRLKVAKVKKSVYREHYENDLKLSIAIERMAGEL